MHGFGAAVGWEASAKRAGSLRRDEKVLEQRGGLHNTVNVLNAIGFCTLKWLTFFFFFEFYSNKNKAGIN
jgi:hypothetical protein